MVQNLKAGRFDAIAKSVPNRVAELLDCETISGLMDHAGKQPVQTYLEIEIVKLAASVNVNPALNLKDHQVPQIAEMLIETYKWESLEDFTLCFRRGTMGFYGEIYRLDGAVIGTWMARYLEEKYDALEQRKAKEKPESKIVERDKDVVDGSKYIEQMLNEWGTCKPTETNNAKENAYQRERLVYTPPTAEQVRERELHLQYIRDNYDPITGKPKEGWIPESEWLKYNPSTP